MPKKTIKRSKKLPAKHRHKWEYDDLSGEDQCKCGAIKDLTTGKPKHAGGRPRKYNTPAQLQKAIDAYFKKCKKDKEPPTICGLAIGLDFISRQALINYEGYSREFHDTIKRAKLIVENGYEKDLRGKNPTGPIFALKQFEWRDKTETVHEVGDGMRELIKDISGRGQGLPIKIS